MRIGSFAWVLVVGAACQVPPPSPKAGPDASDASAAQDFAAAACANERRLGCPEGDPAPDGTSCEAAIRATQATLDYRLPCLAAAQSAADLRACCDGRGCVRAECAGR